MTLENYINEIKLRLTGDVLDLEIEDDTIIKIINSAIRKIQPYYDEPELITVPFKSCISFDNINNTDGTLIKPSTIVGVHRSLGYTANNSDVNTQTRISDPMAFMTWLLQGGLGNILYMQDYAYNYMAYNTALLTRNTTSTDLAYFFNKQLNSLYINYSTSRPANITIAYIPQIDDVTLIKSDYWIDLLIDLSIAMTKRIVGTIRTKYKLSNALWLVNGDLILSEGIKEYDEIIQHLKDNHELFYGID